jgi:hypothetical protein
MSRIPVSTETSPSRSPSPPRADGDSPRSPAESALGSTNVIRYDQLPVVRLEHKLIRRRDRVISRAARLTVFIILGNHPEWEVYVSSTMKAKCNKWLAKYHELISIAVDLTRQIQGPECDATRWVKSAVRRKVDEESLLRELETMLESTLTAIMDESVPQPQHEASTLAEAEVPPTPESEPPESKPKTELTWHALVRSLERGPNVAARVDELINAGVRPKARDIGEIFAHQRFDLLEQMIAKEVVDPAMIRAKESVDDEEAMPLLAYAIKHDLGDSFLMTIVEKGADLDVTVGSGETAQTIVGLAIVREWDEKFIKRMIAAGAPLPRLIDGVALVEFLYRRKQFNLMNVVIAYGSPTDIQIEGKTLLGKMILDHPEFVHYYILGHVFVDVGGVQCDVLSKFDLNAKGAMRQNVLHEYFESQHCEDGVFLKLIELGADPDHPNANQKTPLQILLDRGRAVGKEVKRPALRVLQREIGKAKDVYKRSQKK